jgi:hypothetical protein
LKNWDFTASSSSSSSKRNSSNSLSAQWKGTAKSTGNRCRNKIKNSNGYCYLHLCVYDIFLFVI